LTIDNFFVGLRPEAPNEPLFRLIDGANCPSDDVSTPKAKRKAYIVEPGCQPRLWPIPTIGFDSS
jgi:hypothetical protein